MRIRISPQTFVDQVATAFVADNHRVVSGNVVSHLSFFTDAGQRITERDAALSMAKYLEWVETDALSDDDHFLTLAHAAALGLQVEGAPVPIEAAPYRVSRDTLWTRVKEVIGTEQACAIVASWPEPQRIDWFGNSWFWSNNEAILAMLVAFGLDSAVILAPDPYL